MTFCSQNRYATKLRHIPVNKKGKRIMRFELMWFAWKAKNLPLIYIRISISINFSKEKVGFEPTMLFNILVFKTNALNLSTIYPIIK